MSARFYFGSFSIYSRYNVAGKFNIYKGGRERERERVERAQTERTNDHVGYYVFLHLILSLWRFLCHYQNLFKGRCGGKIQTFTRGNKERESADRKIVDMKITSDSTFRYPILSLSGSLCFYIEIDSRDNHLAEKLKRIPCESF